MSLAAKKRIAVVEDAAESFASRYKGRLAGFWGTVGTFSFQSTKTLVMGEGGMAVTERKELHDAMALYRSHGFLRKQRYYWHELPGHNFRLTNMQAAFGCAQFEKVNDIIRERKRVHEQYKKYLGTFEGIALQDFPSDVDPVLWAMAVKLDPQAYPQGRDGLMQQMLQANIEPRPGFYTAYAMQHLHASPRLPVCEELSAQIISLPTFGTLTDQQIEYICAKLKESRC